MVSQLRVSQIILEATFDLTQTFMRLSLGSWGGFVFPHLEGLMCLNSRAHENSKETVRLRVLYPFSERIKARLQEGQGRN
jgi:hypothetical protein